MPAHGRTRGPPGTTDGSTAAPPPTPSPAERPRPARLEEMTPPREKRAELGGGGGGADARADIPFHKHFEKLLNVVDQY